MHGGERKRIPRGVILRLPVDKKTQCKFWTMFRCVGLSLRDLKGTVGGIYVNNSRDGDVGPLAVVLAVPGLGVGGRGGEGGRSRRNNFLAPTLTQDIGE